MSYYYFLLGSLRGTGTEDQLFITPWPEDYRREAVQQGIRSFALG